MTRSLAQYKLLLLSAFLIWSTVGVFRRYIPVDSLTLVLARSVVGALFMVALILLFQKGVDWRGLKRNLVWLTLSGVAMGLNWLFLFEAFNRTSVAIATVCYYMAPIGVMLLSPVVLKEKLKTAQLVGVLMAFVGIAIVSGLFTGGGQNANIAGILYGLASAFFYMLLVLFNKLSTPMEAYTKTGWQLFCSALVVIVAMAFVTDTTPVGSIAPSTWGLMAFLGVVHTGLACAILFSCMEKVSAQSVALYSYIDPIGAVLLSYFFLHETLTLATILGAVLVLGGTFVGECSGWFKRKA